MNDAMPDRENFYSEEAHEILGRMPAWIIRWGVTVIFVIFAGILAGCYFIRYPDMITAPVVITSINPPADLIVRYDGLIDSICVADGQTVAAGTLVAVLRNAADWRDVQALESHLAATGENPCREWVVSAWPGDKYSLGEVQNAFAEFQGRCRDYAHYLEAGLISRKIRLLQQQIDKNREYHDKLRRQQTLLAEELGYQRKIHRRDSLLYAESVISSADFETSSQQLLQKRNNKAGFDATLTSTELTIIQSEQQIVELTLQQENEEAEYERSIDRSRQQLAAQIAQWKQQYTLEAPVSGHVTLMSYWSENQHVAVGDKFASIVPEGDTEVVGRMQMPTAGFGKVKVGQRVNVKLNGYPYMEYGVLRGTIRSLSAVPEQVQTPQGSSIAYIAEVQFPAGMQTSYKKELQLIQQMDGTGEIITEDMRLIERFIRPVISLFKNR